MELLQRKLKNAVELYSQVSLVVRRKWLQKAKMNMLRCATALVHMYVCTYVCPKIVINNKLYLNPNQ